ncbi:MAG: Holliday junction DNA helicase RuvA [Phycisphaerae bacterium]|nr:Holliday junction DNA helicase RuvA [Phycisphaerae bacterium]
MIARITGRLEEMTETSALVDCGAGLWYEVLIPAWEIERLTRRLGQDVVLHTIHIVEGDPSRGAVIPRLIGFAGEIDRAFFQTFTKVKGIGVRKALRALVRPVAEVAAAIEKKDATFLTALPEVGKRTAEQIIAELHGKMGDFAGEISPDAQSEPIPEAGAEAVAVLVQLGERRADALALVERVLAVAPELSNPETIIQQVYRIKSGGA